MSERTIFRKAPITEALLDIRVDLPPEVTLDTLGSFHNDIKSSYPTKRERITAQGSLKFDPKSGPIPQIQASGEVIGYIFNTQDGKQLVQARRDGFSFHRLKPYDRWETLRDNAKEMWEHYKRIASPRVITRIALRYINRIEIPLPIRNFKEYLLTVPEIAPDIPQELQSLFMRLEIPDPTMKYTSIITETIAPGDDETILPLIFDIDVIHQASLDANSNDVWDRLEDLHELKNKIFFGSITPKTEALFQ